MLKKDFQIFLESDCLGEFKIPKNIQYVTNDIAFINSLTDSLKVFYRYIRDNIKNKFDIKSILSNRKDRDGFDREYVTYDANVEDDER